MSGICKSVILFVALQSELFCHKSHSRNQNIKVPLLAPLMQADHSPICSRDLLFFLLFNFCDDLVSHPCLLRIYIRLSLCLISRYKGDLFHSFHLIFSFNTLIFSLQECSISFLTYPLS